MDQEESTNFLGYSHLHNGLLSISEVIGTDKIYWLKTSKNRPVN